MCKINKLSRFSNSLKNKNKNMAVNDINNLLIAYKILAHRVNDIILLLKANGDIVDANYVAVHKYGYSRSELLSMNICELQIDDDAVTADLNNSLRKGNIYESVHRRKDGCILHVKINSQYTAINKNKIIISVIQDITEQKNMEQQIYYAARHDYITGLPNQFYFNEYISQLKKEPIFSIKALLLISINKFKIINNSYGYDAGNFILKQIVSCFQKSLRENDFFARLGKDEFVIVLNYIDYEQTNVFVNNLLKSLVRENFVYEDSIFKVGASIGIAYIETISDIDNVFCYADAAMRAAKEKGKNNVVVIETIKDKIEISENNRILSLVHSAINKNRFELYLQPISKSNNLILHYEALIRMFDDQKNIILPAAFIPLAEKYGLMSLIDQWVTKKAIETLESRNDLSIFVNISGESLGDDFLLNWIENRINKSKINPCRLGFEITETTAIRNIDKAKQWINRLKELGCYFALDDFGVGFSSFGHLHNLSVDYLKIDGSFIKGLDSDKTKRALVQAMIGVAHALGKKTIAEFVENETIWRILNELDVDYGQGYYLGQPTPIYKIEKP